MSLASLRIRSSISAVISGGANSFNIDSCPSSARSSSSSAWLISCNAESTTATSRSVIPPRADTMAIVGIGPECSLSSPSSPSLLFFIIRPELSRISKSPTVRYNPASARDAPPNLCTSHGLGQLFGDVTLGGQISAVGIAFVLGLLKDTLRGPSPTF